MRPDTKKFLAKVPKLWADRSAMYRGLKDSGAIPDDSIGVEVGVYCADNAIDMKAAFSPKTMYLIDDWTAYPLPLSAEPKPDKQAAQEIRYNFVNGNFGDDVVVLRTHSSRGSYCFPDRFLDWAYIDGDHHYPVAFADMCMYTRKMKVGGIMMCHDLTRHVCRGDVADALNDLINKVGGYELIGMTSDGYPSAAFRVEGPQ